jgi:hypothetical protein
MAVSMDDATVRATFFRDLPGKYKTNADGFACNPNLEKRKYLKRLKEVLKSNVLDKLRSCRDETLAMELMWHRNCQWQQRHEDNDLYLQPQYDPECGKGRLHGALADANAPGYVMDFAETKGKLPNGGAAVTATADDVFNAWKSVKQTSDPLPTFKDNPANARDMLVNFFPRPGQDCDPLQDPALRRGDCRAAVHRLQLHAARVHAGRLGRFWWSQAGGLCQHQPNRLESRQCGKAAAENWCGRDAGDVE